MAEAHNDNSEHVTLLWNLIIRPPRAQYSAAELIAEYPVGLFSIGNQVVRRTDFTLVNERKFELVCTLFEPFCQEESRDRVGEERACVVFCHRAYGSRLDGFNLVPVLLPLNIGLLCFDFAGSGMSGGDYVSLGLFERDDLQTVIHHVRTKCDFARIGLWGQCMGAVAALMHSVNDPTLACIIADSPFSDLWELMTEVCVKGGGLPSFFTSLTLQIVRLVVRRKAGFDICDVSPQAYMDKCFVPTLFLHGNLDNFVAPRHSEHLQQLCSGEAQRFLMPGATHHSTRCDGFVARAAVFLIRAFRWEEFLPTGAVDIDLALSKADELSKRSSQNETRQRAPDLPGESLGDDLATLCFGTHATLASASKSRCTSSSPNRAGSKTEVKLQMTANPECMNSKSRSRTGKWHTQVLEGMTLPEAVVAAAIARSKAGSKTCASVQTSLPPFPEAIDAESELGILLENQPYNASEESSVSRAQKEDRVMLTTEPPEHSNEVDKRNIAKGSAKGSGKKAPPPANPGKGNKGDGKGYQLTPRKADMIPRVPLKKLFWAALTTPDGELSVWEKIHKDGAEFDLDQDELENLFAQAGGKQEACGKVLCLGNIAKKTVFSEQRRRQISCMLAVLPESQEVLKAIADLNDSVLTLDMIELLVVNLPTAQEVSILRSASQVSLEASEKWDAPEEFMILLTHISEYSLRLNVWSFVRSFDSTIKIFLKAQADAHTAADCLKGSARIEKLLAVTLHVGNFLNGGTARGRADGFELDALKKLSQLKAANHESLLDYIVGQVEKDSPRMLQQMFIPGAEFEKVRCMRRVDMAALQEEVRCLHVQAKEFLESLRNLRTEEKEETDALAAYSEIVGTHVTVLAEVLVGFEIWTQQYKELCAWFGVDVKKTKSSDDFFSTWDTFLTDVQNAMSLAQKRRPIVEKRNASASAMRRRRVPSVDGGA